MTNIESTPSLPEWLTSCLSTTPTEDVDAELRPQEELVAGLVEQSRAGCHEAYRRLVEIHQDRIFRFCLGWTGNVEDAEEICQDTFVKVFSALPRYHSSDHFSAWLYRIARNHCHDQHRSRRRRNASRNRPLNPGDTDSLVSVSHQPDENAVRSEDLRRLDAGIAQLPAKLREVIILCAIEGLSYDECASILACSRRAIEGRLYRARLLLAEWFERASQNLRK